MDIKCGCRLWKPVTRPTFLVDKKVLRKLYHILRTMHFSNIDSRKALHYLNVQYIQGWSFSDAKDSVCAMFWNLQNKPPRTYDIRNNFTLHLVGFPSFLNKLNCSFTIMLGLFMTYRAAQNHNAQGFLFPYLCRSTQGHFPLVVFDISSLRSAAAGRVSYFCYSISYSKRRSDPIRLPANGKQQHWSE